MADPIKHVILLMLENHSFDQMLGCMKSVNPDVDGVDPANPHSNTDKDGSVFKQQETDELQTNPDPRHEFKHVKAQLANNNGGFVLDFSESYGRKARDVRQEIMGYYGLNKLPALHALARDFTICDKWFSSLPGPTWPNRFFALSGTSSGQIDMPETTWQNFNPLWYLHQWQDTIFDRLDQKKITWNVYFYDFPSSWLLLHQLEPGNLFRYRHIYDFFSQARDESTFPQFVFIEPKYFGQDQNDDHPPHNVIKAEKLVADVYNAVRSNPELWKSSLLIVTFDEHGGFYDHVVPPAAVPPDKKTEKYAFNQFGLRVPSVLVSPWVKKTVNHTVFDHTSVLKYLIDKWGLGPLGNRTAAANSMAALISEPAARTDTIPFIRVPFTSLIPPHPELEKEEVSEHQLAIRGFSRALEISTHDPRFKDAQREPGLYLAAKKQVGKMFIRFGNWLTRDYEEVQKKTLERLTEVVKNVSSRRLTLDLPRPPEETPPQ